MDLQKGPTQDLVLPIFQKSRDSEEVKASICSQKNSDLKEEKQKDMP